AASVEYFLPNNLRQITMIHRYVCRIFIAGRQRMSIGLEREHYALWQFADLRLAERQRSGTHAAPVVELIAPMRARGISRFAERNAFASLIPIGQIGDQSHRHKLSGADGDQTNRAAVLRKGRHGKLLPDERRIREKMLEPGVTNGRVSPSPLGFVRTHLC